VVVEIPLISPPNPAIIKVSIKSLPGKNMNGKETSQIINKGEVWLRSGTGCKSFENNSSKVNHWFSLQNRKFNKEKFNPPLLWKDIKFNYFDNLKDDSRDFVLVLTDIELKAAEYKSLMLFPFCSILNFCSPTKLEEFNKGTSDLLIDSLNQDDDLPSNWTNRIEKFNMFGDPNDHKTKFDIEDIKKFKKKSLIPFSKIFNGFFQKNSAVTFVILLNNYSFVEHVIFTMNTMFTILEVKEVNFNIALFIDETLEEGKKILGDPKLIDSLNDLIEETSQKLSICTQISFKNLSQCFDYDLNSNYNVNDYSFPFGLHSTPVTISPEDMKSLLQFWDPYDINVYHRDIESNEKDFFLGNTKIRVNDIKHNLDVARDIGNELKQKIIQLKKVWSTNKEVDHKFITFKHTPCSGASTIIRRVAFELREILPCFIFKENIKFNGEIVAKSLGLINQKLDYPIFLLIIDGDTIDQKEFQHFLKKKPAIKAIVLNTSRCFFSNQSIEESKSDKPPTNKIDLDLPFQDVQESVKFHRKLLASCDPENKEEFIKKYGKNEKEHIKLYENNKKEIVKKYGKYEYVENSENEWVFSPLFMGLYAFKENFKGIKNLVSTMLNSLEDAPLLREILGLIALGDAYTKGTKTCLQMIQKYVKKEKSIESMFKDYPFVLDILKKEEKKNSMLSISTSFQLISREVIKQLCRKEDSTEIIDQEKLKDLILLTIDMLYKFEDKYSPKFERYTHEFIYDIFYRRDKFTFSPLLEEVPLYQEEILKTFLRRFNVKQFPYFDMLLSRYYRNKMRVLKSEGNDTLAMDHIESALKTCESMGKERHEIKSNCNNIKGSIICIHVDRLIEEKEKEWEKEKNKMKYKNENEFEKVQMNFFAKTLKLIEDKYTEADKAFDESLLHNPENDHAKTGFIGMVLRITNFIENHFSKKIKFFDFIQKMKNSLEFFPNFIFSFAEKAWSYKEAITNFEVLNDKAKLSIVDLDKLFLFKEFQDKQDLIKILSSNNQNPTNSSIVIDIYICIAIKESFGSWKKLKEDAKEDAFNKIATNIENHLKNLENDDQSKVYFDLTKPSVTKLYRLWIEICRYQEKIPMLNDAFNRCQMWCKRTGDIFSWYYILVTGYMAVLCGDDVNDYQNDIRQALNMLKDSPKFSSAHLEYYNVFNPENADMSGLKNTSELIYVFGDPKFYDQFHKFGGVNDKQMIVKTKDKKFTEVLFNGLTFLPQSTGEETAKIDNELMNNSTISGCIGFSISTGAKVYKIEKL
jgi:hypothetical protein